MEDKEIKNYLADISAIRKLMDEKDEATYVENWAYSVFGLLVLIGTGIMTWLYYSPQGLNPTANIIIWVTIFIIAFFIEVLSWFREMSRKSLPLFSKKLFKFFTTLITSSIVIFISGIYLSRGDNPMPGLILLLTSVPVLLLANYTRSLLFFNGILYFITGIIFIVFDGKDFILYTTAGLIIGLSLALVGIIATFREKKNG
jgi:hypothetical protein